MGKHFYIREIEYGTPDYHQSILLRTEILRIPLSLEFTVEELSLEYDSYHLGLFEQTHQLIGCLVLKPIDKKVVKMRQVAIADVFQGQGLGTLLVRASEVFSKAKGFSTIQLHARASAIAFYKHIGYAEKGEYFEEVGLTHVKMLKKL